MGKLSIKQLATALSWEHDSAYFFGTNAAEAKKKYRKLAKLLHPDAQTNEADVAAATSAFASLSALWEVYDPNLSDRILLGKGDIADVFTLGSGTLIIKKCRLLGDFDLMEHEVEVLTRIKNSAGFTAMQGFYPEIEEFDSQSGESQLGYVNCLHPKKVYTLAQLSEYFNKLDPRHIGWIWRRLIMALGYVHNLGIVHGAVTPDNILIYPEGHGLILIDWVHASLDELPVKTLSADRLEYYPPDMQAKPVNAHPKHDIYMAAQCMLKHGGRMPLPMLNYFSALTRTSRVSDFDTLNTQWSKVLYEKLKWEKKFVPMDMVQWEDV